MRVRSVLANQWTRRGETDSLPLGQVVVKYGTKFLFFLFFVSEIPAYIWKNEITITNGALSLNLTPRSRAS